MSELVDILTLFDDSKVKLEQLTIPNIFLHSEQLYSPSSKTQWPVKSVNWRILHEAKPFSTTENWNLKTNKNINNDLIVLSNWSASQHPHSRPWIMVINQNFIWKLHRKKQSIKKAQHITTQLHALFFLSFRRKSYRPWLKVICHTFRLKGNCIITPLLYSPNRFYLILADFRIKFPWSCCKSLKKIIKNERNDSFVSFIVISLWDSDSSLGWLFVAVDDDDDCDCDDDDVAVVVFRTFLCGWFIFQTLNFIFRLNLIWKDINYFGICKCPFFAFVWMKNTLLFEIIWFS